MKKENKKPLLDKNKFFSFITAFIVGGGVGYMVAHLALGTAYTYFDPHWFHKLALFPMLVVSFFFVIGFHEMGHVWAGLSQKFEFRFVSVGPLMFEKELDKLVFKWNNNFNTMGGLALCLPKDDINLSKRFVVFTAGGPVASFVLSGIGFTILHFFPFQIADFGTYLLHAFLFTTSFLSLGIGIVTVLPMQTGGFTTDGGRIVNLLRKGPTAEIEATLLSYISKGTAGIRARLYDPNPLLRCVALPVESPMKPYLHSLLYNHFLDANQIEKAAFHLDEYLKAAETFPPGYVATLYLEKAWFEARFNKNVEGAKSYFSKEKIGVIVPKSLVLRAEAAIAFAEQNTELAKEKAADAIAQLPKLIDKGAAVAEKEWLEAMLSEVSQPA